MQSNGGRLRRAWVLLRRSRASLTWMFMYRIPEFCGGYCIDQP